MIITNIVFICDTCSKSKHRHILDPVKTFETLNEALIHSQEFKDHIIYMYDKKEDISDDE